MTQVILDWSPLCTPSRVLLSHHPLIVLWPPLLVICQSCPRGWEDFQTSCYRFTRNPRKTVIAAEDTCLLYNSHLISVNTLEEHQFVTNWLRNNDPLHRKWLTSGRDTGNNAWKWDSDRTDFTMISDLWLPYDENSVNRFDWTLTGGKHAAYKWGHVSLSLWF